MIRFDGVTKRYGRGKETSRPALDDVSFTLEPGEVFGYIGPNGAGKTTTIKIIVGLIRRFEGSVTIAGTRIGENPESAEVHRLIGYMPQSSGFQPWRTVTHTLATFGRLSGIEPSGLQERIDRTLERVGLVEDRNRRLTHLSGGTLQRLRLAQAVLHEPRILVLDEPMSGLDPASRYRFKRIIRELADERRVILFSSHILSDVEDLATRIGILSNGSLREIGTPAELRSSFGLGQIVEVETADSHPPIDPNRLEVSGVERIDRTGDRIMRAHISPDADLDEAISAMLAVCAEGRLPVRRIAHLRPSLEEVYLKLTGSDDRRDDSEEETR